MSTPISELAGLAEEAYSAILAASEQIQKIQPVAAGMTFNNSLLTWLQQWTVIEQPKSARFQQVVETLAGEREISAFREDENGVAPMIMHQGGGTRGSLASIISSLFMSAAQRIYYLRLDQGRSSYVRTVLENFEELLRAGRGESVRAYNIVGYSGIRLPESSQVQTPWGALQAAPADLVLPGRMLLQISAILAVPRLVPLTISYEPNPSHPAAADPELLRILQHTRQSLPLAFALATIDGERCAPMVMFETTLTPIVSISGFSLPGVFLPPRPAAAPTDPELRMAEDWCRRLNNDHDDSLQVAERRVVSAIAQRPDRADSLIDAVIAWESIVGTRTETVFRVTAALTRLLEHDLAKRREFRKRLAGIYDIRSRVVHGEVVDNNDVSTCADEAIRIALMTLSELYTRNTDWRTGKSGERADRIILES